MHFLLLFAFLGSLFCFPFFAFSQTTIPSDQEYQEMLLKLQQSQAQAIADSIAAQNNSDSSLDARVTPLTPGPNVPVSIFIESYLADLYKATISWSINDVVVLSGIGKTAFTFQNGPGGQTTTVSVNVVTNTGLIMKKNFTFTPVGVAALWEADTYTPPFYKGKALMSPQSTVRIVAVPEKTTFPASDNLVYTWEKDNYVNTLASGYGKNVFSFTAPKPLQTLKLILYVSTLNDSAQSKINIYPTQAQPSILFYEKDPLLGVLYNKPLGSEFSLNKKEVSISAEPYFFSNERETSQPPRYSWSVNGVATKNNGREITLRNDAGAKGASLVSLEMRGVTQNYQTASQKLKINLGGDSSSAPIF